MATSIVDRKVLSGEELRAVLELETRTREHDETEPLSEHVIAHLSDGGDANALYWLALDGDKLVGFGVVEFGDVAQGATAELVVDPSHRRQGVGRDLLKHMHHAVQTGDAKHPVRLWAHGNTAGAAEFAKSIGAAGLRTLWTMKRSLLGALPEPSYPDGVRIRTFDLANDGAAWLELNRAAFVALPDQAGWTMSDLLEREHEPWFDPAGFFLAEHNGELAGAHWTRVHGLESAKHQHRHPPMGEVYVLSVSPSFVGKGLGRALSLTGLHHLRRLGLTEVMLYVDEENHRAIKLYEGLGFTRDKMHVSYGLARSNR